MVASSSFTGTSENYNAEVYEEQILTATPLTADFYILTLPVEEDGMTYLCPIDRCGLMFCNDGDRFMSNKALRQHIWSAHRGTTAPVFTCKYCEHQTETYTDLGLHTYLEHEKTGDIANNETPLVTFDNSDDGEEVFSRTQDNGSQHSVSSDESTTASTSYVSDFDSSSDHVSNDTEDSFNYVDNAISYSYDDANGMSNLGSDDFNDNAYYPDD